MPFHIGLLLFPDITQLDMTGPYEVFIKFPDTKVHLVWKSREPVTAGGGMQIVPTMTFAECPQLDLICVPGGGGMNALLNDAETLGFIRASGEGSALCDQRVHRRAGARRGRAPEGQARRDALDEPRDAVSLRRDAGRRARRGRRQHDHRRRRHGGDRFRAHGRCACARAGIRAEDRSSAWSTTRTRRSMRARPSAPIRRWWRRRARMRRSARPSGRRR